MGETTRAQRGSTRRATIPRRRPSAAPAEPPKAPAPDAPQPQAAIVDNVRATLATAIQVLDHFHDSLARSGFAASAPAYQRMAETLLGQRMWIEGRASELGDGFEQVGRRARSIHALLAPFAEAMMRLAMLAPGAPSPVAADTPSAPPTTDPLGARITGALDGGSPMSLTALRACVGCGRPELLSGLARLEQAGVVRRFTSGSRELYELRRG